MNIVFWILIFLVLTLIAMYLYVRKVPHGWVEFKSGLILKFLPALDSKPIDELRTSMETFIAKNAHKVKVKVSHTEDLQIPTRHGPVEARLFNPGQKDTDRAIFFIHGGGWCVCSIDTHHEQIKRVANATGLPVVAINYSLSPEHKFPVAFEECVDAISWIGDNASNIGLPAKLVVMGDSAGGNLSITAAREFLKPEANGLVDSVVAIYPCADGRTRSSISHQNFENGYYLSGKAMDTFADAYLRSDEDRYDVRVSPILVDEWKGFPPTFVLTAEFDPLRDEGEALAKNMQKDGVSVKLKRYDGAIHGFFGLKDFGKKGLTAVEDVAAFLR